MYIESPVKGCCLVTVDYATTPNGQTSINGGGVGGVVVGGGCCGGSGGGSGSGSGGSSGSGSGGGGGGGGTAFATSPVVPIAPVPLISDTADEVLWESANALDAAFLDLMSDP